MSDATQNKPEPSKSITDKFWDVITSGTFVGLVIFAVSLVGIGYLIYLVVSRLGPSPEFGLPILALLSVLLLLGALLIFTTLIHVIGLSDKNSALGLPDGSVRALLALALLGLFAVMASSVLSRPATPPDDFGRQMLTLVGTLMTAVISFYFGSATTSSPAGTAPGAGAGPSVPNPSAISPMTAKTGTSQAYTITGTGLGSVTKVEALPPGGGPSLQPATLQAKDTEVKFELSLPAVGSWRVQVTSGTAAPIPVPGAIQVTAA